MNASNSLRVIRCPTERVALTLSGTMFSRSTHPARSAVLLAGLSNVGVPAISWYRLCLDLDRWQYSLHALPEMRRAGNNVPVPSRMAVQRLQAWRRTIISTSIATGDETATLD